MMMISSIDEAEFFTNDEYQAINGTLVKTQALIEKSFTYKVARCPSNDNRLFYSPGQLNAIIELKHRKLSNSI